ncbi:MAG: acetate--CoA ligase family protein, partial [Deltaproteobacteria bacterium]
MNATFKNRIEGLRKGGAKVVPEGEMKEILKQYGVPVPKCKLCVTAEEAVAFPTEAGFPVVLKLSSDRVLHKTELKGVRLDLNSNQEVRTSFASMDAAFRKQQVPGYLGILVEKQSEKGTELIIGLQYDAVFGPVMMMGLGGIFTDILKDVVFRMLPLTKDDIIEALKTLKAWPLLNGYRGSAVLATDKLIDALHAISVFGTDYAGQYDSVDFNPVIARQDECTVVDAKMVIAEKEMPAKTKASEMPRIDHLSGFFNPKSVAVIGASNTTGKIGNTILDSLLNLNFQGNVYPINPKADKVQGLKAYPSLAELPEIPEMVAISVSLELVPDIVIEMGRIGAHNAFIVSGGGRELGGERADIEDRISKLARDNDVRIVGPNCIGSFDGNNRFDSFFYPRERLKRPKGGSMSFITQSGTWGCAFLESAMDTGVGKMVSYGNRVDVDEGDLIAYLADDPETKVIG